MSALRHLLLVVIASAGLSSSTFSQENLSVQIIEASCDTLYAEVSVFFPFGAGSICPSLSGFGVLAGDATTFISLYYDISGFWPQVGCTTTTTVAIPTPSGNMQAVVGTFNIAEGDTSGLVSEAFIQLCATGFPDILPDGLELRSVDDHLTWPRPTDYADRLIEIIGSGGQLIRTCDVKAGSCWVGDLAPGVYLARWSGRNGIGSYRFVRD